MNKSNVPILLFVVLFFSCIVANVNCKRRANDRRKRTTTATAVSINTVSTITTDKTNNSNGNGNQKRHRNQRTRNENGIDLESEEEVNKEELFHESSSSNNNMSQRKKYNPFVRRNLRSNDDCGECPFDVFYHFEALNNGQFRRAIFQPPGGCVLAAIRDEESRRGAQYAIPPGDIALTQGYFQIDDYIYDCRFQNEKTIDGNVTSCYFPYQEYFENYESSDVVDDPSVWVAINFPLPDGALFAAIGADGLLRPVLQTSNDLENFGYSGAVYECCPDIDDVCEIVPDTA